MDDRGKREVPQRREVPPRPDVQVRGDGGVEDLWSTPMCLDAVSKDVAGELRLEDEREQGCRDLRPCGVAKTKHLVSLEVRSHQPCDSRVGQLLDGRLDVAPLVSVRATRGLSRGPHRGDFVWWGSGLVVQGSIAGLTGVGTHREPAFGPCQECDEPSTLEGRLDGVVVRADDDRLLGREVTAVYLLQLDQAGRSGDASAVGTVEGVVVRDCRGRWCVDVASLQPGTYPNPWSLDGHTFEVFDRSGRPLPDVTVSLSGGPSGSKLGVYLEAASTIALAAPAGQVTLSIETFNPTPVQVVAVDATGAAVATALVQISQTVVLVGARITTVRVEAPERETWLTELCVDARPDRRDEGQ